MYSDNDILDAPQQSEKKPLIDTQTEKMIYIGVIFFQYFLILIGIIATKSTFYEFVFITWLIALILHPITQLIQFFSSIVGYVNTQAPERYLHFILLILCPVIGFADMYSKLGVFFLIIMPHGLAWFYIYILHAEQKERERLLSLYKPVKKGKR